MKILTLFASLLFSASALAAGCPDFSGQYTNIADKENINYAISQTGCTEVNTSLDYLDIDNMEFTSLKTDGVFRQVRDNGQTELEKATFTADSLIGETVFTVPGMNGSPEYRTTKYTTVKSGKGDLVTTYAVYDAQGNQVAQSGYTLSKKTQ
jgi:hypothetical protein